MADVLNELLIVLRRPGRRVHWTHIVHILARARNALGQIIDLLLYYIYHRFVLVIELITFIYQFTFESILIGHLNDMLINFIYSGIYICYP